MILMLARRGFEHDEIADFKGLATRDPMLAALMLVLMFSTAGVPPFIGFWAKLWIIQALLGGAHVWLATFAVLISVIGAFYYLRVVWYMYFESPGDRPRPEARGRMRFILVLNTAAVVALGLAAERTAGDLHPRHTVALSDPAGPGNCYRAHSFEVPSARAMPASETLSCSSDVAVAHSEASGGMSNDGSRAGRVRLGAGLWLCGRAL